MQEGKRQKQVAGLINEELTLIFQKQGLSMVDGSLVSIASVKVTPDLLEARIYLSLFQAKDPEQILQKIEEKAPVIKRELSARIKHQLRRMPELKYFLDDTLEQVFRIEALFKKIKDQEEGEGK
ncbi:MAG: 30S ribosome-binding factor RbfA [Chitinophagaceae bacterium]